MFDVAAYFLMGESMPLAGLQFGRYQLLRLLGSGAMSEVRLVEDVWIEQQVAIKVFRSEVPSYIYENSVKDLAYHLAWMHLPL